MRLLIAEDDLTSRNCLKSIMSLHNVCDTAINDREILAAFQVAWNQKMPYELIFINIHSQDLNGRQVIRQIRELEKDLNVSRNEQVKFILVAALHDPKCVFDVLNESHLNSYIIKPITVDKVFREMKSLGFLCNDSDLKFFN